MNSFRSKHDLLAMGLLVLVLILVSTLIHSNPLASSLDCPFYWFSLAIYLPLSFSLLKTTCQAFLCGNNTDIEGLASINKSKCYPKVYSSDAVDLFFRGANQT